MGAERLVHEVGADCVSFKSDLWQTLPQSDGKYFESSDTLFTPEVIQSQCFLSPQLHQTTSFILAFNVVARRSDISTSEMTIAAWSSFNMMARILALY